MIKGAVNSSLWAIDSYFLNRSINLTPLAVRPQVESPAKAKRLIVRDTVGDLADSLGNIWADPTMTQTTDVKHFIHFLLDVVFDICRLPPVEENVLGFLDERLVPLFGAFCAQDTTLASRYTSVAHAAMRASLQAKTIGELCRLSIAMDIDTSRCEDKTDIVRALLFSGKALVSGGDMESRAALLALRNTLGTSISSSYPKWRASRLLGEWDGVTTDNAGRVVELAMWNSLGGRLNNKPYRD